MATYGKIPEEKKERSATDRCAAANCPLTGHLCFAEFDGDADIYLCRYHKWVRNKPGKWQRITENIEKYKKCLQAMVVLNGPYYAKVPVESESEYVLFGQRLNIVIPADNWYYVKSEWKRKRDTYVFAMKDIIYQFMIDYKSLGSNPLQFRRVAQMCVDNAIMAESLMQSTINNLPEQEMGGDVEDCMREMQL